MQITQILFYILISFIAYSVGRVGHIYFGYMKAPHHWIYGGILMIVGLIFYKYLLGVIAFYFGVGYFISDFKDFLQLRCFGVDEEGKKKFWGID